MTDNNDQSSVSIVMSFDFEMRWGVHDVYGLNFEGYRKNLENCRPVVLEMLRELSRRNLRATWATVGALGLTGWDEYFSMAPKAPAYVNSSLVVRREYADLDPNGKLHFAPDLIREILKTEGQELGSHSFSHLYFREPGVTKTDFLADMNAVEALFQNRFGVKPISFVFPRNQSAFTELFRQTSIRTWRETEPAWFYDCTARSENRLLPRALRLIDSVNPWVRRASRPSDTSQRASLFVRFELPEPLWRLQLQRISRELKLLTNGEIFHLWWHPHNLGFDLKKGMQRLMQLLDIISEFCEKKRIVSTNMCDHFRYVSVK